jgi:anti-sigma factor RsiW
MGNKHIDDDSLEAYSLGRLSEYRAAPVEEHLLICAACRARLVGWDRYLAGMKTVLRKLARLKPRHLTARPPDVSPRSHATAAPCAPCGRVFA